MSIDLDHLKRVAENATPGPWERGDRWHIQGASHCECQPRFGPLVWEGLREINGTMMQTHVHRRDEPWWQLDVYSADPNDGYPQQVLVETTEYGTLSDANAEYITTMHPGTVLALIERVQQAELPDGHAAINPADYLSPSTLRVFASRLRKVGWPTVAEDLEHLANDLEAREASDD